MKTPSVIDRCVLLWTRCGGFFSSSLLVVFSGALALGCGLDYGDEEWCEEPDLIPFQGALQTSEGAIEFDTVEVSVNHSSLDASDPCVTSVSIWFRKSNDFSCELYVAAEKHLDDAGALLVTSVIFAGEGQCPGFPSSLAGGYFDSDRVSGSISLGTVEIEENDVLARACHESSITVRLDGALELGYSLEEALEEFSIDGTEFVIEGPFDVWDEPSSCPVPRE